MITAINQSNISLASLCCLYIPLLYSLRPVGAAGDASVPRTPEKLELVKVGVIVDSNSTTKALSYMNNAYSDFYEQHAAYRTRLSFQHRDTHGDVVAAASAAMDLMENGQVDAIIGPECSSQARFVLNLGARAQVPIISFSATSPLLSPAQNPYFVRTAYDDCSQVPAIVAIVQAFGWKEVVPIYEDTDYGNGLIPFITDAFQQIDTRVPHRSAIPKSAKDIDILNELIKIMNKPTRVFLVHMTSRLGSRLFFLANQAGMLNEETAWIVTDGLTSLLDPDAYRAIGSMQGVIGVRPYLPTSRRLVSFEKKYSIGKEDANLLALWAYDTVWALADAAEKSWNSSDATTTMPRRRTERNTGLNPPLLINMSVSDMGPKILRWIRNSTVKGLTGHFRLVNGQLLPSAFEIFNVAGRYEEVIGYWTSKHGLSSKLPKDLARRGKGRYSTSKLDLKPPIWPGGSRQPPKGWVMPAGKEKKMRIGVPVKEGFSEFFKIVWDPHSGVPTYSGFSHDVFLEVLNRLPFAIPYEFIPFGKNGDSGPGAGPTVSYDEMIYQIPLGNFDAVVGDVGIVANRSNYVDYALPYTESGVLMLVAIKNDERRNMWIFLKPLKWDLWLTTVLAVLFTAFVVLILERRKNEEFNNGSKSDQVGLSLWFTFSTLVFAHRERVINNLTRMVLVIWVFVVLIITQSYTASLASLLTVQRLQPKFVDVDYLVKNDLYVGYETGSFVRQLLIEELKFSESRLRDYGSIEEYHDALSKGSDNGGVAAIIDEIPCIRLFLAKYCNGYTTVGPTYKTGGFGFAFTKGSPLISYVSRAVLNVTQDKAKMDEIERKNFLVNQKSSCHDGSGQDSTAVSSDVSLSLRSFGGLFIITGAVSLSALLLELLHTIRRPHSSSLDFRETHRLPFPLLRSINTFMDVARNPWNRTASRIVPLTSSGANGTTCKIGL